MYTITTAQLDQLRLDTGNEDIDAYNCGSDHGVAVRINLESFSSLLEVVARIATATLTTEGDPHTPDSSFWSSWELLNNRIADLTENAEHVVSIYGHSIILPNLKLEQS